MHPKTIINIVNVVMASTIALIPGQTSAATSVTLMPTEALRFGNLGALERGYLSVYNDGAGNIQHSIMRFAFSSIPNYAIIDSAILVLTARSDWGYAQPSGTNSSVFAVADQWDINVSWSYSTISKPWSTPGGDVTGGAYATNFETIIPLTATPVEWDVTDLVSQWTSGTLTNNGLLIQGTVGNQLHFYPIDASEPSYVPRLDITYSVPEPSTVMLCLPIAFTLVFGRKRNHCK